MIIEWIIIFQSDLPITKPSNRELPRFSSATTIGSLSTNTSFQTCADYGDDSYDGDSSNIDAHDVLQNVNVPSDIDSLTDVLSSMGIQSPKQQQVCKINSCMHK